MAKKREGSTATAVAPALSVGLSNNGHQGSESPDLAMILTSLQAMRNGDFSVRLPGAWTGL
ncbi:MAG TPA: hypothetical protein VH088_16170, partial [Terriglobales bacterium]|nr:hypothetical protein [Terriglobales bacterium]